jgi:hypothetical protein
MFYSLNALLLVGSFGFWSEKIDFLWKIVQALDYLLDCLWSSAIALFHFFEL